MATATSQLTFTGTTVPADGDWAVTPDYEQRISEFLEQRTGIRPRLAAWAEQIHGSRVLHVRSRSCLREKADAFYTEKPGIALTVRTADCAAVMVDANEAIGLAHAGMAGSLKGIVPKLIRQLERRTSRSAADFRVKIGPHICDGCYRVSPNNRRFLGRYPESAAYITERGGADYFSLGQLLGDQLRASGVRQIAAAERCTHHDGLFSARHGHQERLLSYIMRTDA